MHILLADDHPTINNFFKFLCSELFSKDTNLHFTICNDCKTTKEAIALHKQQNKQFDLAILDFSMPADHESCLPNGGAVCKYLNSQMPNCKVLINTSLAEKVVIFDIIQDVKPQGIAIKSDMDFPEYVEAIKILLDGKSFKSPTASQIFDDLLTQEFFVIQSNRIILQMIADGFNYEDIGQKIQLSVAAVRKRIAKMKRCLAVDDQFTLLYVAKQKGYV